MRRILRSIRRLSIRREQGRLASDPAACGACRGRGARLGGEARRLRVLRASRDRPLALGPRAPPFAVSKYGAAPHPPAHDALDASIEGPDPVRRRPAHGEVVEQAQAHGRHGRAPHFADGAEDGRAVLLELGRAGATVARSPPARPHAGPAAPDPVRPALQMAKKFNENVFDIGPALIICVGTVYWSDWKFEQLSHAHRD